MFPSGEPQGRSRLAGLEFHDASLSTAGRWIGTIMDSFKAQSGLRAATALKHSASEVMTGGDMP
ncbi:MAG: hypothetical protein DME26_19100 [Verrucomicrobia bacterium]|nr:MAG: hypothetical protein DME26_19100 [Verrucomicrobiota bacterium]